MVKADPGHDPFTTAREILAGRRASPPEILGLIKVLEDQRLFGLARRLLAQLRNTDLTGFSPALRIELSQHHARCTYKDQDLPVRRRLLDAITILDSGAALSNTTNPETLGLAGAVYKRLWEFDGQRPHLERSLAYYLMAHHKGDGSDAGYTGVNAAFILDLLASLDEREMTDLPGMQGSPTLERRGLARTVREEVITQLLAQAPTPAQASRGWWFLVTLAEAYFGLGNFDSAMPWLEAAAALPDVSDWQRESTARQLAMLARILPDPVPLEEGNRTWKALSTLLGGEIEAVCSVLAGKVGLALSGGGFRASLFHIGVLARLAELDLLRHVEVLSCVSGGSIVGAFYYLKLKSRLEAQPTLSRDEYVTMVAEIERDFLSGVQKNLRVRLVLDPWDNIRMAAGMCSRSDVLATLYDKHLFSLAQLRADRTPLSSLRIVPADDPAGKSFNPRTHNWRRHSKVPMLILNATSLNTGHNWQFTASWMGEPPDLIDHEVDANDRLRRFYHSDAPPRHRGTTLGTAVAASSCVPGPLPPLAFDGLYPSCDVRLVDGGVYDNQGVAGLLEQNCTVLIVSDASGQDASRTRPGDGSLASLRRSNDILMQRVREAEYQHLAGLRTAGLLRAFAFVHLKKDLKGMPLDWIGCPDPTPSSPQPLTGYGIRKDVQEHLAGIRTDLDTFHNLEANALMYSGYVMLDQVAAQHLGELIGLRAGTDCSPHGWRFLKATEWMREPAGRPDRQLSILAVSRYTWFKAWRLSPALHWLAAVTGAMVALALGWAAARIPLAPVCYLALLIPLLLAAMAVMRRWAPGRPVVALFAAGPAVALAALAWLHLHVVDGTYRRGGEV